MEGKRWGCIMWEREVKEEEENVYDMKAMVGCGRLGVMDSIDDKVVQ